MSKSKADGTIREPIFPVEIPAGAGVIPDLGATRAVIPAEIQEAAVITAMTEAPYSLHADIFGLLQALAIEKTYVAGLSAGGMAAQEFVLAHPDMVDGLVLVSAGLLNHPRSERRQKDWSRFVEVYQTGTREQLVEIAGERDYEDFLSIADLLAQRIAGAQKVVMNDSAHIPPMDQPERFNAIVLEFLDSLK